jgi:hypothetical protein
METQPSPLQMGFERENIFSRFLQKSNRLERKVFEIFDYNN